MRVAEHKDKILNDGSVVKPTSLEAALKMLATPTEEKPLPEPQVSLDAPPQTERSR
jgi:hypothetical protein